MSLEAEVAANQKEIQDLNDSAVSCKEGGKQLIHEVLTLEQISSVCYLKQLVYGKDYMKRQLHINGRGMVSESECRID